MLRFLKPLDEVTFTSRPENIRKARYMIARHAKKAGFDQGMVDQIELAVGEACANAVEHGSPRGTRNRVCVRCSIGPGQLTIEIIDQGHWQQPSRCAPGEVPLRGRGIPLMLQLMDEVTIEPTEAGTHVRLTIRLAAARRKASKPHRVPATQKVEAA